MATIVVRFILSASWQDKFTQIAKEFAEHQQAIRDLLQIHTSLSIVDLKQLILDLPKQFSRSFFEVALQKQA